MGAPNGLDEIVRMFGDPRQFVLPDGGLSPAWERNYIVRIPLPEPLMLDFGPATKEPMVSQVTVHKKLADRLSEALELVYENGLWEQLGGYSGGFAWRPARGTRKVSTHAWGIAWDFGASRDPLGDAPGGPDPEMPLEIVRIFESLDFTWGGRWARPDQMHFQFAKGY